MAAGGGRGTVESTESRSPPQKHLYSSADAGHATAFEHADDVRRILERAISSASTLPASTYGGGDFARMPPVRRRDTI
jgi:hypothetical protein